MAAVLIDVDDDLLDRASECASQHGVSLSELCRRGLVELLAKEPSEKPWMAYAGIFDGRPDDSASVDEVVYGRERP